MSRRFLILCASPIVLFAACGAMAQTNCSGSVGPDLIIGDISGAANFVSDNGLDAFSTAHVLCNIGTAPVSTQANTNRHEVIGMNLYRLKTVDGAARFEQIGMSWLFHGFFSLGGTSCCQDCQPTDGSSLGVKCSSADTAGYVGTQSILGPRWQVNSFTGQFPFPPANPSFTGALPRRLQARISDLDPAQDGGGSYFIEKVGVSSDDAVAGNAFNNCSYRPCSFVVNNQESAMVITGQTQREQPAVRAWRAADASVVETEAVVRGDGVLFIAARATGLGDGVWRYEYAVENINCDRSAKSFAVPIGAGSSVSNAGYHDVDYHDGDGINGATFDGTDWNAGIDGQAVTWSTDTFAGNPNANALRWGTLYNFRFDINRPPVSGQIALGTFKVAGSVNTSTIIPKATCAADVVPDAGDGMVNIDDLVQVITSWGSTGGGAVDVNRSGQVNIDDLVAIVTAWGPCD